MALHVNVKLREPRNLSLGIWIYWKTCEETLKVVEQSDDGSIQVNESESSDQDMLKYFNLWRDEHLNVKALVKVSLILNYY